MRGIDISSWQGSVDFNKVKADGIEFCILREGYRKTIDSRFKEYVSGCKSAGIPILGCYHFIYWNGATIKENAVSMINNMRLAGLDPFDTWLFADLEYDSWTKAGETVSKSRCTALTKEFLDALKELGCNKLAIYCNQDYYRNYLDWNVLSDYRDHLWLADYEGEPGYKCSIQQTGSTGKVNGISGNVDTDTCFDKSMMKGDEKMACTRQHFVDTAKKYIGWNESDGSAQKIMKLYDEMIDKTDVCSRWGCRKLYFAKQWHWCEAYVSAMAYVAGCTDVVPCEMSCWSVQQMAKKGLNGSKWIPYGSGNQNNIQIGDLVLFDWDGGHSETDHVGIITSVTSSGFTTVEGNAGGTGSGDNYLGKVVTRTVKWSNDVVTGFIHCNFASSGSSSKPKELTEAEVKKIAQEVIDGKWGNGEDRKNRLTQAGYNYSVIQAMVNAMLKGDKEEVTYETYTVKKGDTMWAIAKAHGLTLESLIVMNPQIENPNLIYVGQKINVKKVTKPVVTSHKIVKGDTFESIAKKYGVTTAKLAELNVGITLKVR